MAADKRATRETPANKQAGSLQMSSAAIALKRIAIFADLDTDAFEAIGCCREWPDYFEDTPGVPG